MLYKLKFAQSNIDETNKALGVACDTLKARGAHCFARGEKEGYEAAMTMAKTTSIEKTRAHDALIDAINDSQADTRNARSHKAVRLAELDAVLAELDKLTERRHLTVTQNEQKDVTAETRVMATTTCERITMEEAKIVRKTLLTRLDAAQLMNTEAFDDVDANFAFTELLLEGCCS